jgi:hypothetical protein
MQKHRSSLVAAFLVASCASTLAWVGQTAHDWSLVIPDTQIHFGIVEWQTGSSTVYLGLFDFSLPCGAFSATILLGLFSVAMFGAGAVFVKRRSSHDHAA